jgi:hypothetical protein
MDCGLVLLLHLVTSTRGILFLAVMMSTPLTSMITMFIINGVSGYPKYFDNHRWPWILSFAISGSLWLVCGLILQRTKRIEHGWDEETGEEIVEIKASPYRALHLCIAGWGLFVLLIVVFNLFR